MKVHGSSKRVYSSDKPIIEFSNVTKNYIKTVHEGNGMMKKNTTEKISALNGVDLSIQKGDFVFIVGPSGSGKSTLIKLMLKELEPSTGEIQVWGDSIKKISRNKLPYYRRKIGVVFQDFRLLPDRTVYENVAFAMKVVEASPKRIKENVPYVLSLVEMVGKRNAYPNELSGGEQQRVAIARALVNQPSILLCDEPTGNLDPENTLSVMKSLEFANKIGTTVVVVTHNMDIVQRMRKRTITMSQGKIIKDEAKGGYFYED
jgi:cell division transport system ATP-binding protein